MKEGRCDIFKRLVGYVDAICITTNGFVKKDGTCVMGRGIARQAAKRWPDLPKILGNHIKQKGNVVGVLLEESGTKIVSFPVKPKSLYLGMQWRYRIHEAVVSHMAKRFHVGDTVPGWACKADLDIIRKSAIQLVTLADLNGWERVALPRPGCGAGELSWEEVKRELETLLDDRFAAFTFPSRSRGN